MLRLIGKGRVVGVDIEIRQHSRRALQEHDLYPLITLIEGDSICEKTVRQVAQMIRSNDVVLVFLDGCHEKDHVAQELEIYSQFVSVGSYIVAMDGIMEELVGAPRANDDWVDNNPAAASREFVERHSDFILDMMPPPFNEGNIQEHPTYFRHGYIKRVDSA